MAVSIDRLDRIDLHDRLLFLSGSGNSFSDILTVVFINFPDQSDSKSMSDGAQQEDSAKAKKPEEQDSENQEVEEQKEQEVTDGEGTPALSTAMQPALTFSDSDTLVWPVVGNILVNYSMEP